MDENEIKTALGKLEIPTASAEAKERTVNDAFSRLQLHSKLANDNSFGRVVATFGMVAVALFGVLSYAVTQSSRSGGGDASSEKSLVSSSAITQYPAGVRTAIIRMVVAGGVNVENILFDAPENFIALKTDAQKKAAVFYPTLGGGATYALAPAEIMASGQPGTWIFSSQFSVAHLGLDNYNEIIAFLPGVAETLCAKLDSQLGIALDEKSPPEGDIAVPAIADNMVLSHQGIGAFSPDRQIGAKTKALVGQPFGCFRSAGVNVYYHVLVER